MKRNLLVIIACLVISLVFFGSCGFVPGNDVKNDIDGDSTNDGGDADNPPVSGGGGASDTQKPDLEEEDDSNTPYENFESQLSKFSSEGLVFELVEGEEETYYVITGYEEPVEEGVTPTSSGNGNHEPGYVLIPNEHEGHPVKEIEDGAFRGNKSIKKIYFMRNHRFHRIGKGAFKGCENLEDIRLPNGNYEIGSGAFDGCDSLEFSKYKNGIYLGDDENRFCTLVGFSDYSVKEFVLHEDVYNIGAIEYLENLIFNEYENCYYIGSHKNPYFALWRVIDKSVTTCKINAEARIVAPRAFEASSISSVNIPKKVRMVGDDAFAFCSNLSAAEISDNVEYIGDGAFTQSGLVNITFGKDSKLAIIGAGAFRKCISLEEIVFPAGITEIAPSTFTSCYSLSSVIMNDNIQSIGEYAFSQCVGLNEIAIGNGVEKIDSLAFGLCKNLTKLVIGRNVEKIDKQAFHSVPIIEIYNLSSIEDIASECLQSALVGHTHIYTSLDVPSKQSKTEDGFIFYDDGDVVCQLVGYVGHDSHVKLPETYSGKGYVIGSAFSGMSEYRPNLVEVTIPDSVTQIRGGAFSNCYTLKKINIGSGVTAIGNRAFAGCTSLNSITIPITVTDIDEEAFWGSSSLTIYTEAVSKPDGWADLSCPVVWDCSNNDIADDGYIYTVVDGIRYGIKDGYATVVRQAETIVDAVILPSVSYNSKSYVVKAIADNAFEGVNWNVRSVLSSVVIPDSVISIGEGAFVNSLALKEITIPDGVVEIGMFAFRNCPSLSKITLGESIESIGNQAFGYCYSLIEIINKSSLNIVAGEKDKNGGIAEHAITVHNGDSKLEVFGDYRFMTINGESYLVKYVGSESELVLPSKYKGHSYKIYDSAFYSNNTLTKVVIPDGVTAIGARAFELCLNLHNVSIAGSVVEIGDYAFRGCSGITDIELYHGIKTVGDYAFNFCWRIRSLIFPDSIEYIGDLALPNTIDDALSELIIPNGIKYVGSISCLHNVDFNEYKGAYYVGNYENPYCVLVSIPNEAITSESFEIHKDTKVIVGGAINYVSHNIQELIIPDGVRGIGRLYVSVKHVVIPDSIEIIDKYAFVLQNVEKITLGEKNKALKLVGDALYTKDGKILLTYFGKAKSEFKIPDGVETIAQCAFRFNDSITCVVIPDSVVSIDYSAFEQCTSLASVKFGSNSKLLSIGERAFRDCSSLVSIVIPDSVTEICDAAFNMNSNTFGTNLVSVTLGRNVSVIERSAFIGCGKLVEVINRSSLELEIGSESYGYVARYAKEVHTGDSKIVNKNGYLFYTYSGTNYLLGYSGQEANLVFPAYNDEKYVLYGYAFSCNNTITSVTIPACVSSIPLRAFNNCANLQTVTLDKNAFEINIHSNAFENCENFKFNVYENCNYLPSSDNQYFALVSVNDKEASNYTIHSSTEVIMQVAFMGCKNLENIIITEGVTYVGQNAFARCTNLESVVIPTTCTNVTYSAFSGCSSLSDIYYCGTEEEWNTLGIKSWSINYATVHFNYTSEK